MTASFSFGASYNEGFMGSSLGGGESVPAEALEAVADRMREAMCAHDERIEYCIAALLLSVPCGEGDPCRGDIIPGAPVEETADWPVCARGEARMTELLFIIEEDYKGVCRARAVGQNIAAQADTREGIEGSIREAVRGHFGSIGAAPRVIHLHFVHDKTIGLQEDDATGPEGEETSQSDRYPLRVEQPYRFDDPFSPAAPSEDWDALK